MSTEEKTPIKMIEHYLQLIMHSQEKIAVEAKRKADAIVAMKELVNGIIYGVIIVGLGVAGGLIVITFGGTVIDYVNYDLMGNERLSYTYTTSPSEYELELFEPTLDDQMIELARKTYDYPEHYAMDMYKNCLFGMIYSYIEERDSDSFDLIIDDKGSQFTCYSSMIDEIEQSFMEVMDEKRFFTDELLSHPPDDLKNNEGV